jgi:hypothetical protein
VNFYYDTEFLEDGRTIELISIGVVADDGRELYAVNEAVGEGDLHDRIRAHGWLMANVVPHLPLAHEVRAPGFGDLPLFTLDPTSNLIMPRRMIRNAVRDFLLAGDPGEDIALWADYGAYDHVALAQLFGPMIHLPDGVPMFTNDIRTAWTLAGRPALPAQKGTTHNALDDARHVRACVEAIDDAFAKETGPDA